MGGKDSNSGKVIHVCYVYSMDVTTARWLVSRDADCPDRILAQTSLSVSEGLRARLGLGHHKGAT